MTDIERRIKGWEYWCPDPACKNRTYVTVVEMRDALPAGQDNNDTRHLTVRVFKCARCSMPTVLGTYKYFNREKGWSARETWIDRRHFAASIMSHGSIPENPYEYLAFQEPGSMRELPTTTPKKVAASFREAEYAVGHQKPIGAAAAIRNAIRLLVESEGVTETKLKAAIKLLDIPDEYRKALGDLKLVGDHTLHFEEYEVAELKDAIDVLYLVLSDTYRSREQLKALQSAVGSKASKKGKINQ